MGWTQLVVVAWLSVGIFPGSMPAEGPESPTELSTLAADLGLTGRGVARWLEFLGAAAKGEPRERLVAVSVTGKTLLERQGGSNSVVLDPDFDRTLRELDNTLVLVHNHPWSVGLSDADLEHVGKPGVAAVVAVGHDGSVFMASAGPRFDPARFEKRHYALARAEVLKRLRAAWQSGSLPVAAGEAHFSHLVTLALAKAGVVRYWFKLHGVAEASYEEARIVLGHVVVGAAARLAKQIERR